MDKSPDAFRTISEVAEWLDIPTHVLRFWESRFAQIKPVKRAGGRRYYRPADMRLIGGIKRLLHDEGMTIRGVQKLLREEGVKHVQGYSQPLEHEMEGTIEMPAAALEGAEDEMSLPFLPAGRAAIPEDEEEEALPLAPEELADAAWAEESTAPEEAAAPEPEAEEAPVLSFGSVRKQAPAEQPMLTGFEADPEPEPEDEPEPEPEPAPPAPLLADVPETDPEDEDEAHAAPPGIAARLLLLDRSKLARDPIRIEQVVAALRAVRDRSA